MFKRVVLDKGVWDTYLDEKIYQNIILKGKNIENLKPNNNKNIDLQDKISETTEE